jgi:hypothetical protein
MTSVKSITEIVIKEIIGTASHAMIEQKIMMDCMENKVAMWVLQE